MIVPADPLAYSLNLGFMLVAPGVPGPVDFIEWQYRYSSDDSVYTDWLPLETSFAATNFTASHFALSSNIFYQYRYRFHYGSSSTSLDITLNTYSDWSDYVVPGAGGFRNTSALDQLAQSIGTFTTGVLRGIIFETSASVPKVRMDPTGFMSVGVMSTPIFINALDGSVTASDSLGNTTMYLSPIAGANFSGTIFAKGGIYQNLGSTPTLTSTPLAFSKFKWLDSTGAETVSVYGVNQGYGGRTAAGSLVAGTQIGQGYRARVLAPGQGDMPGRSDITATHYWKMNYDAANFRVVNEISNISLFSNEGSIIKRFPFNLVVGETDGSTEFPGSVFLQAGNIDMNTPFAIDFWFYPKQIALSLPDLTREAWLVAEANRFKVTFRSSDQKIRVYYLPTNLVDMPSTPLLTSTTKLSADYHYIAVTLTNTSVNLYINNNLEATNTPGIQNLGNSQILVGDLSGFYTLDGVIDELAYYRATPGRLALATPDISDHYYTGKLGASSLGSNPIEKTILDTDGKSDFLDTADSAFISIPAGSNSLVHNTFTKASFASATIEVDNNGLTDTGNSQFVVKTRGLYLVTAWTSYTTNATGIRISTIHSAAQVRNISSQSTNNVGGIFTTDVSDSAIVPLNVGDSIDFTLYQNSGGNLTCQCYFGIARIGKYP